jgi:hypothetical protein
VRGTLGLSLHRVEQVRRVGLCTRVRAIRPLRTLSVRRLTTAVGKTLVIWMDRISDGRLADTNTLFIPPVTADGTPRYWAERILGRLPGFRRRPSALFVRRYQPFHEGHRRLIEEGIRRVDQAGIAARDREELVTAIRCRCLM